MGILSRDLIIIIGLLIPFAGIIFPLLVLLLFQVSHPAPQEAPAEKVREGGAAAWPASVPQRRVTPEDGRPIVVDSGELVWFRDRLRECAVFEGLSDSELGYIAAIGHRRKVAAGERLAEGGSRGETLFVVLEGELRLLTHTLPEALVRTAHAGEAVPLAVILDPPVLVTTVEAAAEGEVLVVPRKRLLGLLEQHPLMGLNVYRAAAKLFEHRYRATLGRRSQLSAQETSGGNHDDDDS
jgi:hypothetical protein